MRPRFLLVLGHQVGGRPTPPWPGPGRRAAGAGALDNEGAWVAWRLLGSNHREVARSAAVFSDIDSCLTSLRALQAALAAGSGSISVEAIDGLWSWLLVLDGEAVAVASRLYQRQRECDYNCRVFLKAAPLAELTFNPAVPRRSTTTGVVVAAE